MRPVAVGLGAHTATLTRVEAEIPSEVPSGVGDVLGELGDEIDESGGSYESECRPGGPYGAVNPTNFRASSIEGEGHSCVSYLRRA